ncbi:hypothetical protein Tco_1203436 [Tanacetum coccineum]
MASSACSSTQNPPKKAPKVTYIDLTSNEDSPQQLHTTIDTTLALTIPPPIPNMVEPFASPLVSRALPVLSDNKPVPFMDSTGKHWPRQKYPNTSLILINTNSSLSTVSSAAMHLKRRVVLPDFLEDEPNLRPTFRAIGFDCLLDIDEQICPVFVLQFYKSFRLIRNLNGTICVRFTIDNVETILTLENFAQILRIPCEGVCLYSHEWSISSLQRSLDPHPNLYPHPTEEPSLVRDALFKERPEPILRKIKGDNETLEPFQMLNTEFKDTFNKWYLILNENVICLTGHKDHPNVSLCYMLYCLSIGKRFNLAYYIVHRMMSVTQSSQMTLPYAMLLTRLFKHVQINHPHPLPNEFNLVDHVMIPLSNKRKNRIKTKGKRPRLLTPTPSNSSGSSQSPPNQGTSTNPSS